MALRPMGLSNAASNFVNAYTMGKQLQNERLAMAQQQEQLQQQSQIKALMGQALMGQAQPGQMQELAQLDPNSFMKIQQMQAEQQAGQAEALAKQDQAESKLIEGQRADFIDWEDDLFDRVKAADPEDRATVYNQLMSQGRNVFHEGFFSNAPSEYDENVDKFIGAMGDKSPSELKSGRFKDVIAPNGDVYELDTATGEREFLYKGAEPEVKLLSGMETRLANVQDSARKSDSKAREYDAIANDFENLDVSAGGFSTGWEALKDFTGQQDYESALRRKWMGVKASQVVENLPPGAASDKDIAMAMSGFPPNNASPEIIASFMRGVSKLERENAKYNRLEAQWIATQGNTAQAKRDFDFNGIPISKGDTLLNVYERITEGAFEDTSKAEVSAAESTVNDIMLELGLTQ